MHITRRDSVLAIIVISLVALLASITLTTPRRRVIMDAEQSRIQQHTQEPVLEDLEPVPEPAEPCSTCNDTIPLSHTGKVHAFYYSWYGNPEIDGQYIHWNHRVLVDGGKNYVPPVDIGANFYPKLGLYSSKDARIINKHMQSMSSVGITTVILSWWGRSASDENGVQLADSTVRLIMDEADKYNVKIAFHLEPYKGRSARSTKEDITFIYDQYGKHNAFYRVNKNGRQVGLFYMYDSYLTPSSEWSQVLPLDDAVLIALMVSTSDMDLVLRGGFDGFYTYFATPFTFGSNTANWKRLADWAHEHNKTFIPCVGPGYDDRRLRPWNAHNMRDRVDGKYYDNMWSTAVEQHAPYVAITSYNEWHEGTQIEEAVPAHGSGSYIYSDYSPLPPDYYMTRTKYWAEKL